MHLFFSFLRTLILLGAMQGLILSGLLYYSKTSRQSNRIFGHSDLFDVFGEPEFVHYRYGMVQPLSDSYINLEYSSDGHCHAHRAADLFLYPFIQ